MEILQPQLATKKKSAKFGEITKNYKKKFEQKTKKLRKNENFMRK